MRPNFEPVLPCGKHGLRGLNCWRLAPVAQGIEQRFPKPLLSLTAMYKLGEPVIFLYPLILPRLPLSQTPLSGRAFTATARCEFLLKFLLVLDQIFCYVIEALPCLGALMFHEVLDIILG